MTQYLYNGYVETVNKRFEEALSRIEAHHNFEHGDEFEVALCKVLRQALPNKCGICRGYVVDLDGQLAGDDIIIYDRARFPTLRALGDEDFARLERIPVEAVYGYIEAKHTLELEGDGGSSLAKAVSQVRAVKALCEKRQPVSFSRVNHNITLAPSLKAEGPIDFPPKQNPSFGMIVSRNVRLKPNAAPISDGLAIANAILHRTIADDSHPDAVILGHDVIVLPIVADTNPNLQRFASPFFLPGRSTYTVVQNNGMSFGLGLCLLLYALDWIQLGEMSWTQIIVNGSAKPKNPV